MNSLSKPRILIAEDESIPALDLKYGLMEGGYDIVHIAVTGEEAIEKARDMKPDIILMDIHLRGPIDGIAAAERVKEFSDIPIIYCTAHSDQATVDRATKTVPHGFLLKPYQFDEVRPTIELALYKSRLERELRKSEERYRLIADGMNDVVFALDLDLRITYVTPSVSRVLGYSVEEFTSKSVWDVLTAEDGLRARQYYRDNVASWVPGKQSPNLSTELELRKKDGSHIYCEVRLAMRTDKPGNPIEFVGVGRDITTRKLADERMRASEERFRSIIEQCSDGFMLVNRSDVIVEWNKANNLIFQMDRSAVIGQSFFEFQARLLPPERNTPAMLEELREFHAKILSGNADEVYGKTMEVEIVDHRGRRLTFLQTIFPVTTVDGFSVGVFNRDITEHRQIEMSLLESEERFRAMADATPIFLWVAGADRKATYFNRAWREFTGRTIEQEVGDGWIDNVHPDDQQQCRASYLSASYSRVPASIEYRLRRHDGEYRWILDHGSPRVLANGMVAGYIGSCVDITDRKRMEDLLALSEYQYRTLVEGMTEAVMQVDNDDVILFVNQQFSVLTGYEREDVIGKKGYALLFDENDRETILQKNSIRRQKLSDSYTVHIRTKSGKKLLVRISGSPVLDRQGNVVGSIGVLTDIGSMKLWEAPPQ